MRKPNNLFSEIRKYITTAAILSVSTSIVHAEAPSAGNIEAKQQLRAQQLSTNNSTESIIFYDYFDEGELRGGIVKVEPDSSLSRMTTPAPINLPPYNVVTTLNNGPAENRVDIVVIGDGYMESELGIFATNSANIIDNFFSQSPLAEYHSYFNVHRVDVISIDSGVDHDPEQGVLKDTALDMGYWCSGTERLLCVSVSKAIAAANNAIDVDQILAIANSTKYGGAGYSSSNLGTVSGNNSSAVEVAIHEFGHSFADLADEYNYGQSETYTGLEFNRPNVSIYQSGQMLEDLSKWYRWMDLGEVDTFEGANYHVFGAYRPTINSKMKSLGQPFGPINIEQFIIKIYQTVSPIDDATPTGIYNHGAIFTVTPIQPADHDLDIQWWVDGVLIDNDGATEFDTSGLNSDIDHSISVRVTENTGWVRDESARDLWMTEDRVWTLLASNFDPQADISLTLSSSTLGWAEPFQFWLNADEGVVSYELTVTNHGPQTSENVTLTDILPSNASTASYTTSQGSCNASDTPTCELGDIEVDDVVTITVEATVMNEMRETFSSSVDSDTLDPDTSNNSASKVLGGGLSWGLLGLVILFWRRRVF